MPKQRRPKMTVVRARQGVITRILPHQGNKKILIPGGKRGFPLNPPVAVP